MLGKTKSTYSFNYDNKGNMISRLRTYGKDKYTTTYTYMPLAEYYNNVDLAESFGMTLRNYFKISDEAEEKNLSIDEYIKEDKEKADKLGVTLKDYLSLKEEAALKNMSVEDYYEIIKKARE